MVAIAAAGREGAAVDGLSWQHLWEGLPSLSEVVEEPAVGTRRAVYICCVCVCE